MLTRQTPGFFMRHLLLALLLSVPLIGCSDQSSTDKPTAADIRAGKAVAERECKGLPRSRW